MKYHITTIENIDNILKNGLLANQPKNSGLSEDGYIYLFDNKSYRDPLTKGIIYVADHVAKNQLLMEHGKLYAMLEIDEDGIKNQLELDDVGELPSALGLQWKVKQDKIEGKYINLFGIYKVE